LLTVKPLAYEVSAYVAEYLVYAYCRDDMLPRAEERYAAP